MIHRFESIDSTMTEAARLAAEGCPHLTAVVAAEQTAGHGRHGRSWHSAKGDGLYVSLVLRVNVAPAEIPLITMALGVAAAEAITEVAGVACDLRWPNDVLIGEKKCTGILTELHGGAVVAGIGINLNHTAFPAELGAIATSLRMASGRAIDSEQMLAALMAKAGELAALFEREGREPILRLFEAASSYVRGKRVAVELAEGEIEGVTDGLDAAGFLVVRRDDGQRTTILAGGVRPARKSCS